MATLAARTFTPALLVVDMQYDFVHGSLAVPDAPTIINNVNDILRLPFRVKIGTKDYHPPNHVSFAATHSLSQYSTITIYPPGDDSGTKPLKQVLWPTHCVAGTPGCEFVEDLRAEALNHVVLKGKEEGIESYSAFRDPWHMKNTELPSLLESNHITDVFIVGLAGDYCVMATAIDAIEFGYKTWVVTDAVKSVSGAGTEWREMEDCGIKIISTSAVKEKLSNLN
ncbi:pyrazinamidase/nicotinamidase [Infundibulicybe gibba]|nr:pyrazinamidase/nicotinamidase [Infundibulicybe gibba]